MKLYYISRELCFHIFARFPNIQLLEAGELFITGFLSDDMVKEILAIWPQSIQIKTN